MINTSLFQESANHFRKHGYYCSAPVGTKEYIDFWQQELDRCKDGYSVGGMKITGHHYFYLNYCRIMRYDPNNPNRKILDFPDFWDGDYNFFWCLHIAKHGIDKKELKKLNLDFEPLHLDGNRHMLVVKARRKGFSYKSASIVVNIYNTVRNSYNIVGAYDSNYLYPDGTMRMVSNYMDFLNEHTAWAKKRQKIDKVSHKRASFLIKKDGLLIEKGYKSEIRAISFHDNPDAGRGKDIYFAIIEEAGKFPNLKEVYTKSILPACKSGQYYTGQVLLFGTGGSIESHILEEMFWNPDAYDLLPFEYREGKEVRRGCFFFPATWNLEGFYDSNGRSDRKKAEKYIAEDRKKVMDSNAPYDVMIARLHEFPIQVHEAFYKERISIFPVNMLREQLANVMSHNFHLKSGTPAAFYIQKGEVRYKPTRAYKPLYMYNETGVGCPIVWQDRVEGRMYVAGLDPYMHDEGKSLGALYIVDVLTGEIVAEYVGRPETNQQFMYTVELMCEYYNAPLMHENNVPNVKTYFMHRKKLHMLMATPDMLIDSTIRKVSKSTIKLGIRMTESVKRAGERYLKEWLLEEDGNGYTNIDKILSPALLQELIHYDKDGNYDRVMALMMTVFAIRTQSINGYNVNIDIEERMNTLYRLSLQL